MAAQYDQLGNYLGDWETEEERRKREEEVANTLTSKREVETFADGSQTVKTTQEVPAHRAVEPVAIKPVQQQPVAQPVNPELFNRVIQAESGGRNYDAQGRPLTSPKGAMFAAQVMPATAASPGFGVQPAQAQTPEEYNRVGAQLFQKLLQQYGGDEQKAVAAYNAGFGRVNQNIAQNQGQLNVGQLPQETQGYLQKVLGGVGNVVNAIMPSAQAGTLPQQAQAQTRPNTVAQQQAIVTGATPKPEQQANPLLAMQDDPIQMLAAVKDPATPAADKQWLSTQLRDKYMMELNMNEAKKQVQAQVTAAGQGDRKAANDLARELQKQEGSWSKMILLGFISPQLAGEEAVKLGFGNKWVQGYNDEGKPAVIQVNAKGMPLKGFDDKGQEIASNDLVAYTMGGKAGTKADVSTQDVERNGQAGRVITQHLPNGQTRTMVESGGKMFPYDTSWKPRSISTSYDKRQQELGLKLQYVGPEKVAGIIAEDEAKYGPLDPQVKAGMLERAKTAAPTMGNIPAGGAAQPAMGAPAGQAAPTAPVAPTPLTQPAPAAQAAPAAGQYPGERKTEREVSESGRKEVLKKAGDIVATSDKLVTEITKAEVAAQDVLSKPNNFGTILHGQIPGEYTVGKVLKTQDHINTMNVLDTVNKVAATNAKMLGTNPTDRDLQFVTSTKPDETWSASAVAEWLRRSAEGTRRTLDFARKQMETGGKFVPETPAATETPTKRLSREDQQAVEWVRKNPNDPRAAEIKKRLGL